MNILSKSEQKRSFVKRKKKKHLRFAGNDRYADPPTIVVLKQIKQNFYLISRSTGAGAGAGDGATSSVRANLQVASQSAVTVVWIFSKKKQQQQQHSVMSQTPRWEKTKQLQLCTQIDRPGEALGSPVPLHEFCCWITLLASSSSAALLSCRLLRFSTWATIRSTARLTLASCQRISTASAFNPSICIFTNIYLQVYLLGFVLFVINIVGLCLILV